VKAAIFEQFKGKIEVDSVKDPMTPSNGVIIKVASSGLCRSDWHGWMGHDPDIILPHVPGHELAGIIAEVGFEVKKWKVGERVTVPFVGGCGSCTYCSDGNQQVCDNQFQPGFTAWGSFAEYVAIKNADENLVRLPADIGFTEAASLGCRFITSYRAIKDQGKLLRGQFLAVHGCGGVGLSAIQIGSALGARVIAVDISESKCDLAKSLGAEFAINSTSENVVDAIKDLSSGGVHVSMDALGHTETFLNSIHGLRKQGKHIQVGLMTNEHATPPIPMPLILSNELEIIGSHGMQAHRYAEMFELIRSQGIDIKRLISKEISIEEVPTALPTMANFTSEGITVISSF